LELCEDVLKNEGVKFHDFTSGKTSCGGVNSFFNVTWGEKKNEKTKKLKVCNWKKSGYEPSTPGFGSHTKGQSAKVDQQLQEGKKQGAGTHHKSERGDYLFYKVKSKKLVRGLVLCVD